MVTSSPAYKLVLDILHEAPSEGKGHEEEKRCEDGVNQVRGKDAEERLAYGEKGEGNATNTDESTTNAYPPKTPGGFFGKEWTKENDQPGDTVEERNGNLAQKLEVCKGSNGDGEETNGGEPLEVLLPGGKYCSAMPMEMPRGMRLATVRTKGVPRMS
jgi:hypothetical protein